MCAPTAGEAPRRDAFFQRCGFNETWNIVGGIDARAEDVDGTISRY